jgi:hypothetical protein
MNANKLADELDKYKGIATRDAATMLRQQQAEIEALKQNIGQLVKPTLKIEEVMSEHCTCYKLGYSQLNNYRKVNNENNNEAA